MRLASMLQDPQSVFIFFIRTSLTDTPDLQLPISQGAAAAPTEDVGDTNDEALLRVWRYRIPGRTLRVQSLY